MELAQDINVGRNLTTKYEKQVHRRFASFPIRWTLVAQGDQPF